MDEVEKTGASVIVTTQEPLGVCTVAQQIAKSEHLTLELHFLNFRYGQGAYHERSKEVILASDKVLLIHDGVSHGTRNELELVKKLRKPYRYETLEPDALGHRLDEHLSAFTKEKDAFSSKMEDF